MLRELLGTSLFALVSLPASGVVLYDGSNPAAPQSQGWLSYYPLGAVVSTASGKTSHDTTSDFGIQSGYSNYTAFSTLVNGSFPTLNRNSGYTVRFDARVISDDHTPSGDRAGLSLVALSSDNQGVEIGFWGDQVWAQNTGFTKGESANFNTTSAITMYELSVFGSGYSLKANGNQILAGSLRSYGTPATPYAIPNYLFIGDDTTSAKGAFEYSHLSVEIPEPAGFAVMAIGLWGLLRRRKKKREATNAHEST